MALADTDPSTPQEIAALDELITAWIDDLPNQGVGVAGVERVNDHPHGWYVRMDGEEKTNFSVVFTLGQRTLAYESYFMPAPEENPAELFRHLLVRNAKLFGVSFVLGAEDAVYLSGQLGNRSVTTDELDRVLGSIWMATEQCFRPAMRIGYASRFQN